MAKTNTTELIRKLEAEGYKVTKKADQYARHTFQLEKGLLDEFFKMQKACNMKVMEAIDQAVRDWVKKKSI